jgi:hypothetical protein
VSRFTLYRSSDAPSRASRGSLRALGRRMGEVPPSCRAMAASGTAIRVFGELAARFAQAELTAAERAVVASVVTRPDAGGAVPDARAVPAAALHTDARLLALRRFTEAVYLCRGQVSHSTWTDFEAAGYVPAHALEVLIGIALTVLEDSANRMTGAGDRATIGIVTS